MTTPRIEERRGRKIGEDKYTEHWSLDGHTYIQVPKWVITQAHQAGIEEERKRIKEIARNRELKVSETPRPNLIGDSYRLGHNQALDGIVETLSDITNIKDKEDDNL